MDDDGTPPVRRAVPRARPGFGVLSRSVTSLAGVVSGRRTNDQTLTRTDLTM